MTVNFKCISRTYFLDLVKNIPVAPCPDQWAGTVDRHGHVDGPETEFVRRPIEERERGVPALFLILESPHCEEYEETPDESGQRRPVGPANGSTGARIRRFLKKFASGLSLTGNHSLLLMNAVRHQCSAGVAPEGHRDVLFRACWNIGGADDFETRLKEAFVEGDIIVNACTVGDSRKKDALKVLVERQIRAAVRQPSRFWTYHPSSWLYSKRRVFLRVPETLPSQGEGWAASARKRTGLPKKGPKRSPPPAGSSR